MIVVAVQFLLVFVASTIQAKLISDHWKAMDPRYDTSYLDLIQEVVSVSRATCAAKGLSSNFTAFGYVKDELRCLLLNVDYYVEHPWTPPLGTAFFLRDEAIFQLYDDCLCKIESGPDNPMISIMSIDPCSWDTMTCTKPVSEPDLPTTIFASYDKHNRNGFLKTYCNFTDIDPHPCISWCPFCMPIVETPMTWSQSVDACRPAFLMEYYGLIEYRCIVMQLQYLRKPTSSLYWVGGHYTTEWKWITNNNIPGSLWAPGEPSSPTGGCVLFDAGKNYTLFSADCAEKHYALCYYDTGR